MSRFVIILITLLHSSYSFKLDSVLFTKKLPVSAFLLPSFPAKSNTALNNNAVYLTNISPLTNDIACTLLCSVAALSWLQFWIYMAKNGKMDSKLSRKIIHTGSAPLYLALLPLFSDQPSANFLAASIPFSQLVRLLLAYRSNQNAGIISAISRTGEKEEALQGPFYYNIILFLVTLFAFRTSIPGIFVISQMAAGDGLADIVGRKFGTLKWPFSNSKSFAGTLGFILGAFTVSCILLNIYSYTDCISFDLTSRWPVVLLISILCSLVELVPIGDDNITVSIAAYLLALYFFP